MILCVGTTPTVARSMIFDSIEPNEANRARETYEYASGKAINVARVIRTLGIPVAVTGFAGGDRGQFLRQDLHRPRIRDELVQVAPQTRLCITVIDRSTQTATELIEESSSVAEESWRELDQRIQSLASQCKVMIFSGSLPPNAPKTFYADQIARYARRASLILDARGEEARLALHHSHFTLKLNLAELSQTVQRPLNDTADIQKAILDATPKQGSLVLTLGAKGAIAFHEEAFYTIASPTLNSISAIGSGDAFAAGLGASFYQNRTFEESLRLAAACGAANALTPHAGHVNLGEIQTLLSEVTIRPQAPSELR